MASMHVRQLVGAKNQPLPPLIDPLTSLSFINSTMVFKAKGFQEIERNW
jgi:hypothetical protein